jgi:hypothetical protein
MKNAHRPIDMASPRKQRHATLKIDQRAKRLENTKAANEDWNLRAKKAR